MAIETRGAGEYYYHKRREGARVVSEYGGRGAIAHLAAQIDDEQKRKRSRERRQQREFERRTQILIEFERLTRRITRAALVAEGCHTHKGQWRKRRE